MLHFGAFRKRRIRIFAMNPPLPSFVDASALTIGDVTGAGDAVIRVGAAAVAAGAIEYFLSRPFVPRLFAY